MTPEKQDELFATLNRIEMGFFGDDKAGIKGIVQKVDEHDKYIIKDKKLKHMIGGALMFIGIWIGKGWDKVVSYF